MDNRIPSSSPDLTQENIEKLKELFPEIVTEGKVDYDMLKMVLGEQVDDRTERYRFEWHGKRDALLGAQQPSKGTLRPDKETSKNFDTTENLYIEGDNLEVLKLLQKTYNGKIKMIYIDPPYNTGNDFIYKDNFRDNIQNYLAQTDQVDDEGKKLSTNTENNGRFHTDWLNMLYPRLKLARNLLTDDGAIFISIDDNEVNNTLNICNEIFDEVNFAGIITWNKKRKGSFLSKNIVSVTEYCLVYCKNIREAKIVGGIADQNESQPLIKRTNKVKKLYFPSKTINTKLKNGVYKKGTYGEGTSGVELHKDIVVENGLIVSELLLSGAFIWSQEKVEEQIKLGANFVINTENFQIRVFKVNEEGKYKGLSSYIQGVDINGTNETAYEELNDIFGIEKVFDYSKPKNYLKKLIRSLTYFETNSIILDFFSGSATTAHATMELNAEDKGNRKFIMVQLPEKVEVDSEAYRQGYHTICDIGKERIRRAGEKILKEHLNSEDSIDTGFKVLKLDKSNIREWNLDFENIDRNLSDYEDIVVPGRTELDVVHEIMLKYGLVLTYPIHTFQVDDKNIYDIAYGNLFICLDKNIDCTVAKAIIDKRNEYGIETSSVVFADHGFNGNDSEKLNCFKLLQDAGYQDEQLMTI